MMGIGKRFPWVVGGGWWVVGGGWWVMGHLLGALLDEPQRGLLLLRAQQQLL